MRTSKNLRRDLLTSVGVVSIYLGLTTDWAAAAEGIEVITVTAERREESIFDAPVTVTALSGVDLRNRGITDIKTIVSQIPNAVLPDDPQHFTTYINIRGIRQADAQAEPNFGFYRNGLYFGGQRTNIGAQVDVERIEVLRGPQAGLYGRDAVGGAINIIYATPSTDSLNGYASVKYGNYNRIELQAAANVPLADNFAVRGAGWYFNQTGSEYINITLNEKIDRGHDAGGRLSAKLDITDKLNVLWMAEYEDVTGPSQRAYAPFGVAQLFVGVGAPETPTTIQRDTPSRSAYHQLYLSQNITHDTEWGRFNLLASYRDYHLTGIEDQDFTALTPVAGAGFPQAFYLQQVLHRKESVRDYYVEGLWTSPQDQMITWIGGVSYFDETFDFSRIFETTGDLSTLFGIGPVALSTGFFGLPIPGTNFKTRSVSAFGEATWHITDQLDLTGGLRWSQDKRTLTYAQLPIASVPPSPLDPVWAAIGSAFLGAFVTSGHPTFSFLAPTATLRYKVSDTLNLYATYGTGFRAGGFNTTATLPSLIPYGQESAENYEVGFKSLWLGGDLGLNGDVFYMRQNHLVLPQDDPCHCFGFTFLTNVGTGKTWGIELEALAHLNDWLDGNASLGWLDPKYSGVSFGVPFSNRMIPYTRSWTFNVGLSANYPLDDDLALVGTFNYRLERGGVLDLVTNYDDLDKVDLTAGVEFNHSVRLIGYVNNVSDDRVAQFRFGNGALATSLGRTYGALLSTTF
jgi:iron complex outermembrane receptor protein